MLLLSASPCLTLRCLHRTGGMTFPMLRRHAVKSSVITRCVSVKKNLVLLGSNRSSNAHMCLKPAKPAARNFSASTPATVFRLLF